jgi:DNA-binding response OmpR family regulator
MQHARLGVMDRQIHYGADLVGYLGRQGITAELHHDDRLLLALLAISPPSMIVLHEAPTANDSLETLRQIRTVSRVPCVVVGEGGDHERGVRLLEAGADDMMDRATPMSTMLARMRAVLRRAAWGRTEVSAPDAWRLRRERRELLRPDGTECRLTTAEFDLFCLLVETGPDPVEREAICRAVFRRRWRPEDRTVDNLVVRLRRKVGDPSRSAIRTVQGIGYMFAGFDGVRLRVE